MKELLKKVDVNVSRRLDKNIARKNNILPYKIYGNKIFIYSNSDSTEEYLNRETLFGKKIVENKIEKEDFNLILENIYIGSMDNSDEVILEKAIKLNSSDIHFEPKDISVNIRIRVDGKLIPLTLVTKDEYQKIKSKFKVNAGMDIAENRRPQDGKWSFVYKMKKYDLRVSTVNTIYGEKLVVRILYGYAFNYDLNNLNLNTKQKEKLNKIMKIKNGITLINGPTGSGKSTTLYTILSEINTDDINIMTIEDPIEVSIDGINQIELNKSIGVDFASGLRSLLRQDPDILMIGEIRDSETAETAIRASITGHKVYSTIHTKDPGEVILRLQSMGIENYMIREALVGLISQRLVRLLCNNCKEEIGTINFNENNFKIYEHKGCRNCNHTGYKGRVVVSSINYIDEDMKNKIAKLDLSKLNNDEMVSNLKELLFKGKITLKDFRDFIEEEDIVFDEKIFK